MSIKSLAALFSCILFFSPLTVLADQTKNCNDKQVMNCAHFCMMHKGVKSCILDMTTRSGTCSCNDGASHSKSK